MALERERRGVFPSKDQTALLELLTGLARILRCGLPVEGRETYRSTFRNIGSAVTPDGVKPSPRSLMDAVNHAFSSLFGGGGKLGEGPWSSFELGLGS
jgi:hypothetical protein